MDRPTLFFLSLCSSEHADEPRPDRLWVLNVQVVSKTDVAICAHTGTEPTRDLNRDAW